VWIESPSQTKFSLHLTNNQSAPRQLVFGSNTEGARHFATRLKKRLQSWHPRIAAVIDLNVYTKDRKWRTPGSAKVEKPQSVLEVHGPGPFLEGCTGDLAGARRGERFISRCAFKL
jgi:hypothetical protein